MQRKRISIITSILLTMLIAHLNNLAIAGGGMGPIQQLTPEQVRLILERDKQQFRSPEANLREHSVRNLGLMVERLGVFWSRDLAILPEYRQSCNSAVELIAKSLYDSDKGVRREALEHLSKFSVGRFPAIQVAERRLSEMLVTAEMSTERAVNRLNVIAAMALVGPRSELVVRALAEVTNDSKRYEADQAFRVLAIMGPYAKEAVPVLVKGWSKPGLVEQSGDRFTLLACTLAQIGPAAKEAVPLLENAAQYYHNKYPDLEKTGIHGQQAAAIQYALAKITGRPSHIKFLIELLRNNPYSHMSELAMWLGDLGPESKEAVPVLVEMLDPGHPKALRIVAIALVKIGPSAKPAVPRLEALLNEITAKAGRSKDQEINIPALHCVLARISGKYDEHVKQLIRMLNSDYNDASRAIAAWMLGEIGPDAALAKPALIAMSKEHPKQTFLQNPAPAAAERSLLLLDGKKLSYLYRLKFKELEDELLTCGVQSGLHGSVLRDPISLSRY